METPNEPQNSLLETFPNPNPERDYRIVHTTPEFTSVCPKTGQPDFATVTVDYVADELCVELKSLKLYFYSFRNVGAYYEKVTNLILTDLVALLKPRYMTVIGDFNVRGGFGSVITATYEKEE